MSAGAAVSNILKIGFEQKIFLSIIFYCFTCKLILQNLFIYFSFSSSYMQKDSFFFFESGGDKRGLKDEREVMHIEAFREAEGILCSVSRFGLSYIQFSSVTLSQSGTTRKQNSEKNFFFRHCHRCQLTLNCSG